MVALSKQRFTRDRWLDFSLQILAKEGPDGLSIDNLCEKSKRTKGSFYHHFSDHQSFLEAMLQRWQTNSLESPILGSQKGPATERLHSLNEVSSKIDPKVEIGFRRLASRNLAVQKGVKAVDDARVAYLVDLHLEAGLTRQDAINAARIQYAGFVGTLVLWPGTFEEDIQSLGKIVGKLLLEHRK